MSLSNLILFKPRRRRATRSARAKNMMMMPRLKSASNANCADWPHTTIVRPALILDSNFHVLSSSACECRRSCGQATTQSDLRGSRLRQALMRLRLLLRPSWPTSCDAAQTNRHLTDREVIAGLLACRLAVARRLDPNVCSRS